MCHGALGASSQVWQGDIELEGLQDTGRGKMLEMSSSGEVGKSPGRRWCLLTLLQNS